MRGIRLFGVVVPAITIMWVAEASAAESRPPFDFTKQKILYVVPYAHLDTQWRWTYVTSIDQFIKNTINENVANFATYPQNVFTFTGSARYEMMKEYYPEGYEKVRELIKAGGWHVGGSSVDENDANVPSPESMIRQVLYGNRYFRKEFGKESIDFMLPDCFGFQAHLPSVWAHCGLRGFSTQKLTWGFPRPVPFTVGNWIGPDGQGVIAALDGTDYGSAVKKRLDNDPHWIGRVEKVGKGSGYFVDYRYFGVGDRGGAPRPSDIEQTLASMNNPDSKITVVMAGSDQMFRDLPKDAEQKLPIYRGDFLLREHSTGSLTSQAYMKRWNRKNEQLADAAERAAVLGVWLGGMTYPHARLQEAWYRVLGSQMHDILPGTSLPKAYELSWNDEVVALNQFGGVLEQAAATVIKGLDTTIEGVPLTVYNPLAIEREDVVEATVRFPIEAPSVVVVVDPLGHEVPAQVISRAGTSAHIAFLAAVKPVSWSVFAVRAATAAPASSLRITPNTLENSYYRVGIDANGDVASIIDKQNGHRELLASPAQLQFQYHNPRSWPAWNMDWNDQCQAPRAVVGGPVQVSVVENGPARVALEIRRAARDSIFVQRIGLAAGAAGQRVEFKTFVDWQSTECALKAAFPLTVSNTHATYNLGLGTIQRPTNHKDQYEVPHREWLDLTATDGSYGVSVLEDSKFGSDKPDDHTLRLTLLYTPGVRRDYKDQYSQDWGRHDITYALYGHRGDWRTGSEWQGRRLNQPLVAFQSAVHPGELGKSISLVSVANSQIDIRAIKQAEEGAAMIVRLQEVTGKPVTDVAVAFAGAIAEAWEVDGQERKIGPANTSGNTLLASFGGYSPKSYAVVLAPPKATIPAVTSTPVALAFDTDVVSTDHNRSDGAFDATGASIPAESFPAQLEWKDVRFNLGSGKDGDNNALIARGQTLSLPRADADHVVVLAAATEACAATFTVGAEGTAVTIPAWTGFIGQFDNRRWNRAFAEIDYVCDGFVTGLDSGFIHREPVAWFSHHRHSPKGNEAYRFTYLFAYPLPLSGPARTLTLPNDPRVRIFAVSLAKTKDAGTAPAAPLYDDFSQRGPVELRVVHDSVVSGLKPVGMSSVDRKKEWCELSMGAPSANDYADHAAGHGVIISPVAGFSPDRRSGVVDGQLIRPLDGEVARNDDDLTRVSWFDGDGRMIMDLKQPVNIVRVNSYSWHKSNRAIQRFSLWGSNDEHQPPADFAKGKGTRWTLLGHVDSAPLGEGDMHGSTVMAQDGGALGTYRWLLWVLDDQGEGTFFTEVDVHAAK